MESKNIDMSYEAELIEYEAAFVNRRIVDDTIELVSATNTPHFVTDVKSWYRPMLNSFSLSQSLYSSQSHQLTSGVTVAYTKKMNKLKLAEEDLAKLTDHRITSIWLHNSTDKIIAAAGDKVGNLGIWDVDFTGTQGSSQGGIYKYRPHVEGITRLHSWPSDHTKLYSVSSDGTIRYLDVVKEVFALGFTAPENINDVSFLDACFNEDGNTVLLGRADGKVSLVDFRSRTSSSGYEWTIEVYAGSRVNSVQQHPTNASLMVTAGGGTCGYIAVHDIRKPGGGNKLKTVHELREHTKSINAAYVSPNGQFIVSVSQDNTVKACSADFTDTTSNPVVCTLPHDNHTGVWLSTFRPTFDPKSDSAFVLGSMDRPRRIEVFNPQKEGDNDFAINLLANLQSYNLVSVCSRNCFHRSLDVIAGGNSSGRVHILR
jgi:WD40 repeat protein